MEDKLSVSDMDGSWENTSTKLCVKCLVSGGLVLKETVQKIAKNNRIAELEGTNCLFVKWIHYAQV